MKRKKLPCKSCIVVMLLKIEVQTNGLQLQVEVPRRRTTYWCEFIKVPHLNQKHHAVMVRISQKEVFSRRES